MTLMLDAALATRLDAHKDVGAACLRRHAPSGSRPAWCVVATYATAEFRADHHLREQRFETYLPLRTIRRTHRFVHGKQSLVRVPLFPGYLFLRFEPHRPWRPITNTPGVFKLLTDADGYPSTCPAGAVEAVQEAEREWALLHPQGSPQWAPGAPCAVANGMFDGVPAVVVKVGKEMALVSMIMFGHLREVTVDLDNLRLRDD